LSEFKRGTFVKPLESASRYIYTDTNMKLGVVIDTAEVEGKEVLTIAPVVHEFKTAEIMLATLIGYNPPWIGMLAPGAFAEDFRPATDEEMAEHADAVEHFKQNAPAWKIKEGNTVIIRSEFPEELPLTVDKEYEIFHDEGFSYHIIADNGSKINSIWTLFNYQVIEGGKQ
jgi:hypothetical protein